MKVRASVKKSAAIAVLFGATAAFGCYVPILNTNKSKGDETNR